MLIVKVYSSYLPGLAAAFHFVSELNVLAVDIKLPLALP
jgi:hypothetical protein